ncbi:TrmH family RNA methyltransferase [Candidatus Nitrotoga arctica]|uniref:RNA methyltransferase n=1 Tax=Candidatus Nitrotoga arctica TaxID=453162 RepID=A0ABN8AP94_9PROT|nr:RNA methyltransferase [Candidatus Nitrotoga arctica]CAG9932996.1 RNA methyltransferase [Candidatus Nitrotoga arctica]
MKYISSHSNPFFKELLKLASSARQRRKTQQTLLEGAHLLQAYHASGNQQPQHLFVTEAAVQNREVAELLKKFPDVPLSQLDDGLFAELSELKTPSCILALIEFPRIPIASVQSSFCLLLEDIQDPGNLGSILRSAAAAGCDTLFLSKNCADAWSPKVLRAGMGGHFVLSIHESMDLLAMATAFQGKVFATVVGAKSNLYDCDLRGNIAFAVGNEGAGLSENLLAVINQHITIPMPGRSESLNVAAATAVCLFEAVRQRR